MPVKNNLFLMSFILLSFQLQACFAESQVNFYVSPSGSDSNPGTLEKPFATLSKARDAVRKELPSVNSDITVYIRGGQYFLNQTVNFTLADSPKDNHKVIYRNFPNETPVFTSAVKITGWKKLTDRLSALPENAQGHIWQANVTDSIDKVYSLYDGNKLLPCAQSHSFKSQRKPDPAPWLIHVEGQKFPAEFMNTMPCPPGLLRNFENLSDVELRIIPLANWSMNILPLKSIDEKNNVLSTTVPGTYALFDQKKKTCFPNGACWLENAIDFLDQPGRWVFDSKQRKIYLWPLNDKPSDNISAASLKQFILLQGQINYDQPTDIPVKNIVFQGLSFTRGQRHTFTPDQISLPGDWECYDTDNALLRFRGAENCTVSQCHFSDSAASAIRLDLHCQNISIENNLIENIGGTGIILAGYGPGLKDVNKANYIYNNKITRPGQIYWHNPAIMIYQSGYNIISHNLIAHTPYNAIVIAGIHPYAFDDPEFYAHARAEGSKQVRWNEVASAAAVDVTGLDNAQDEKFNTYQSFILSRYNRIEFNEIHHAVEILGDGNGIYMSCSGIKNIIRRNYLHHIIANKDNHSSTAIRTDDCTHQAAVVENIVTHCTGGGIALKPFDNYCANNIIANLIGPGHPDNPASAKVQGYIQVKSPLDSLSSSLNIFYHKGKAAPFYSSLDKDKSLKTMHSDYNIFYCPDDPNDADKQLQTCRQKYNTETNSIAADPLFVDIDAGNFLLKPESPALKMGFKQLDVTQMTLTKDFPKNFN